MVTKKFATQVDKNSIDLLYDDEDISIVTLDLLHEDKEPLDCNRNRCHISHESVVSSLETFRNKPIIYRLSLDEKRVTEHARNALEDKMMRVAGMIPNDAEFRFVERENGKTYLNCDAIVYKRYCPQVVDILNRNDGELEVSIEIKASGKQDKVNDIFNIDKMILQGICLLDPSVTQGIEGSKIKVLKFSQNEIDSMNERYIAFSKSSKEVDIFDKIRNGGKNILNSLSVDDLREKLWRDLDKYMYHDGNWEGRKYYIEEIYTDEKEIIVRDNETAKYYKIPYVINDGDVKVKETEKKEVEKGWHERPVDTQRFSYVFAKEDYGTGEAIKVDKSSDAVSDKAWGDVDKTELRHKVLTAKNYKALVYDVYAEVEEGWEDAPSEKLKYPIMLIEGDTAVYSRYGLASALGYAKATNNEGVEDKVEKLYKELKIEEKEDNMDNEQEIQNKIDESNSEIEKIKDDADAIEDDKKEELEKKVENAVVDAPEEDKLHDDIDADKDYWEKKYNELEDKFKSMESEFATCREELSTYKAKEDKIAMANYLKSFKKCFSEDEMSVMASKIENVCREDFEKEVDEKVKEFARKLSEEDDDNKEFTEIKNSVGFMASPSAVSPKQGIKTIDDVLEILQK